VLLQNAHGEQHALDSAFFLREFELCPDPDPDLASSMADPDPPAFAFGEGELFVAPPIIGGINFGGNDTYTTTSVGSEGVDGKEKVFSLLPGSVNGEAADDDDDKNNNNNNNNNYNKNNNNYNYNNNSSSSINTRSINSSIYDGNNDSRTNAKINQNHNSPGDGDANQNRPSHSRPSDPPNPEFSRHSLTRTGKGSPTPTPELSPRGRKERRPLTTLSGRRSGESCDRVFHTCIHTRVGIPRVA
jgi:hypothetical protein